MKLPRPYIPIPVRLQVATRQALAADYVLLTEGILSLDEYDSRKLKRLLFVLFGKEKPHLDHDPALQNRERYADMHGIHYNPAANDPRFLIYRTKENHRVKTLVRGDGAQYSDAALARKNKRIKRSRDPKRKRHKWPTRKFPTQRSLRS